MAAAWGFVQKEQARAGLERNLRSSGGKRVSLN
jgi:hypothetical protein